MNTHHLAVVMMVLGVLLNVTGCEMAPRRADSGSLANTQTIGVISLLGNRLHHNRLGFTGHQNETQYHAVPEWDLDGYVRKIVEENISLHFRLSRLNYDSVQLEKVYVEGLFQHIDISQIESELDKLFKSSGVGGILLVTDYYALDNISDSSQALKRYGLYDRRVFKRTLAGYVSMRITLIDSATHEAIASSNKIKHTLIQNDISDDFGQMPEHERDMVKQAIMQSCRDAVSEILSEMML